MQNLNKKGQKKSSMDITIIVIIILIIFYAYLWLKDRGILP